MENGSLRRKMGSVESPSRAGGGEDTGERELSGSRV